MSATTNTQQLTTANTTIAHTGKEDSWFAVIEIYDA